MFKKYLLLILLLAGLSDLIYSQNQWMLRNFNGCLQNLSVLGDDSLYCSTSATLYKTFNGGQNWNLVNNNIPPVEIYFLNSNTGFIFSSTTIAKTTNGGINWTVVWNPNYIGINDIFFIDNNTGWFCTDWETIYKTTNCGMTWDTIRFTGGVLGGREVHSVNFINNMTGWCSYSPNNSTRLILKSNNGGINWVTISSMPNIGSRGKITFINEYTGWMSGTGSIYKTYDGGYSWSLSKDNISISHVSFIDINTAYYSSYNELYYTLNGGNDWAKLSTINGAFMRFHFKNGSTGWAVGCSGIRKTTNSGLNWIMLTPFLTSTGGNLSFINNQTGYTGTLKTTDAGDNWFNYAPGVSSADGLYANYFLNDNTGFITSHYFSYPTGYNEIIYKTTNGGVNFYQKLTAYNYWSSFSCFDFIDEMTGWAVGLTVVYKTTNTGDNWFVASSLPSGVMKSVKFINSNNGFGATNNGKILKSTNGGVNWDQLQIDPATGFYSLYMINSDSGWVCGSGGKIYKTSDGWLNWSLQQSNTTSDLYSIYFYDANTGWACGYSGIILKTVNSGEVWKVDFEKYGSALTSVKFINQLTGFCSGGYSTILKTTTGGVSYISKVNELIPSEYYLSQNYPNPFNSITKINFATPYTTNAKLIIYDVLGKEVSVLVNEILTKGNYESSFNATFLNSGVYFYKLTTDGFSETKRMILLK